MIEIAPGQYKGLAEALSQLKKIDPQTLKALRRDIRKKSNPYLSRVRSFIRGSESLLRAPGATSGKPANVFHNGRTSWSGASVKATVSSAKYARSILLVEATGNNSRYGYDILDKAGLNGYNSAQGKAMIAMVNSRLKTNKPTRMLYRALVKDLPDLRRDMLFILENYMDQITAKLRD